MAAHRWQEQRKPDRCIQAEGKEKQNEKILSVLIAAILIIALASCVPVCVPGGNEGATENSESDTDESETATKESEIDTEESESDTHESESETEGSSETAESEIETQETGSQPETESDTETEEVSDTDFQPGNLPVVYIHIDGGDEEVQKMNESEDHSYRCTGLVDLYVPDGYQSAVLGTSSESLSGLKMEYIRGRGNSSWGADKKPYKSSFPRAGTFSAWEKANIGCCLQTAQITHSFETACLCGLQRSLACPIHHSSYLRTLLWKESTWAATIWQSRSG